MERTSILVIEDNQGDFDLVRELLPESIELTQCQSARHAREQLSQREFDLILLDHGLPDSNGLALLRELVGSYPDCPIVMLTGREDPALALSALQLGAENYLVKSEILDHLVPTIEQLLPLELSQEIPVSDRFVDSAEQLFPMLLETISDGCLVLDQDGIIIFANRAAHSLSKFPDGQLLGLGVVDVVTEMTRESISQMIQKARASHREMTTSIEARLVHESTTTPVRISMRTLNADNGKFENAIMIMHDLTEQMRMRELREDLIRAMVHDLRTPLNAISGAVELLQRFMPSNPRADELLGLIDSSADKVLSLIAQILDLERLEHGTLPLAFEDIDLEQQVWQAIRGQSSLASSKNLTLTCDVLCKGTTTRADRELIDRVLQNLLANAIRYSPAGETVTVELATLPPGMTQRYNASLASYRVSVIDQGPGIDPAIADRLFEKFVRSADGGSGLGLTFCKFAVEAHGGMIWLESTSETKGTTFTFTLPRQPAD